MSAVLAVLGVLWVLRTVRAVSATVALWQQKEYRLDRMRAHLTLPSTQRQLVHPVGMLTWGLTIASVVSPSWAETLFVPLLVLYGGTSLAFLSEAAQRVVRRPQWTLKARLLTAVGTGLMVVLPLAIHGFTIPLTIPRLTLALLVSDRALPFVVTLLVAALHPGSSALKARRMERARALRSTRSDLRVIGITGSYGKSTTKEVLATLLGRTTDLLKTPWNTNTEIGVADFLLRRLAPHHRTVLCEMAAYRRGEISRIAKIVQPSIGILTAIAPQHLALFGSLEEIRNAKYELIRALPPEGIAIFNGDDPTCRTLAKETTHCRVLTYGTTADADVRAEEIRGDSSGTRFTLLGPAGTQTFRIPLLGRHLVSPVLAAAACALALGIPLATIAERAQKLRPRRRTMQPLTLSDGTLVIDDSYSANPDGVVAAVETLASFPHAHKVVVLPPMIELGAAARDAHRRVGFSLGQFATSVFYTQSDFAEEIAQGIRASGQDPAALLTVEERVGRLSRAVDALRGRETVILLEGRVPRRFRDHLTHGPDGGARRRLPLIALAPNASHEDALAAATLLCRPWRWRHGGAREELATALRAYFRAAHVTLVNSGRWGLCTILRSLNLSPGDEVLLQAYTCVSVPGPVLWAGLRPVFVDVTVPSLTMDPADLRRKITPRSRVLILQHTFGMPADLTELLRIAAEHHLVVIEDCAHTIGARYRGQLLGTFGDAAIVSFGRDKALSSVFGGAILVRHPEQFPGLLRETQSLALPPRRWVAQQLLHPILTVWIIRPLYFVFGIGKLLLVTLQSFHLLSKAVAPREKDGGTPPFPPGSLSNALATLALIQWRRLPTFNATRQALAKIYTDVLSGAGATLPMVPAGAEPVLLRYPLLVQHAAAVRRAARARRLLLGDWYACVVAPCGTRLSLLGYRPGSCPVAESAAAQSVNLPLTPSLMPTDAQRIGGIVRRILEETGSVATP